MLGQQLFTGLLSSAQDVGTSETFRLLDLPQLWVVVLVLIPLAGNTTLDAMIDEVASEIATQGGGRVRLVQTGTENYWYGWSPFTWIVTPVITTVVMEYEPSAAAVEAAELTNKARALRQAARARGDNSHVIPPKR